MGGLVSRAVLRLNAMDKRVSVEKFMSISTPWGGHAAAKFGIRALKYPAPAWIDMAHGSAFLKALWREPLPPESRHYLMFGYDTAKLPWLTPNNDSVIDVNSALFVPAQNESSPISSASTRAMKGFCRARRASTK
jgi:hypothetical protein